MCISVGTCVFECRYPGIRTRASVSPEVTGNREQSDICDGSQTQLLLPLFNLLGKKESNLRGQLEREVQKKTQPQHAAYTHSHSA